MITDEDAEYIPGLRIEWRGRRGTVVDSWDGIGNGMRNGLPPTHLTVEFDDTTRSDIENTEDVQLLSTPLSRPSTEIGWIRRAWNQVYR